MNSIVSAAEGPVNPRFLAYSMKSGEIVQTLIALLKMCASFSRGWCNQMPGINRRRGNKDVRVAIGIVPERTVGGLTTFLGRVAEGRFFLPLEFLPTLRRRHSEQRHPHD
jgi:hypothetical protein